MLLLLGGTLRRKTMKIAVISIKTFKLHEIPARRRTENDSKSGLANPNHTANVLGLVLGFIKAELCDKMFILRYLKLCVKIHKMCTLLLFRLSRVSPFLVALPTFAPFFFGNFSVAFPSFLVISILMYARSQICPFLQCLA